MENEIPPLTRFCMKIAKPVAYVAVVLFALAIPLIVYTIYLIHERK